MWLCIGAGMLVLLLAAISKRNKGRVTGYTISIRGVETNYFLDEKDVETLLVKAAGGKLKGKPVQDIDLRKTEKQLESNDWVSNAELYFDNHDWLHVRINEKEPLARVFTQSGLSFYVDDKGNRLPLSDKMSARVPVFTGFTDKKIPDQGDSVVLKGILSMANYIMHDPFWMAQISQVDIVPETGMEIIPVVGNHIIRFGDADQIEQKFHRLDVFYKNVLSKAGFDKYKLIDVRFRGQVVASKNGDTGKTDSAALRRSVEKMLEEAAAMRDDTTHNVTPLKPIYNLEADTAEVHTADPVGRPADSAVTVRNVPVKVNAPKPVQQNRVTAPKPKPNRQQTKPPVKKPANNEPKAVMPPKPAEDPNKGYN
ncbi:MAG: hypothetical protein IPP73_16140 [Chitinophagaceae bacterium]|nr:hypothetical protein [Chitinophagaceae bacterium]